MSSHTALTIIAVSLAILTTLVLVGVFIIYRLIRHLLLFERSVIKELINLRTEIQATLAQTRSASKKIRQTVQDIRVNASLVGSAASALASWFWAKRPESPPVKVKSLWTSGLTLAWNLYQKRRKKKRQRPAKKDPPSLNRSTSV